MKHVYHYTNKTEKLPKILASGELIGSADIEGERPLLWFSLNPVWEPTATKAVLRDGLLVHLSFFEYRNMVGCARFAFRADDPRLMPWRKACQFAGIPKRDRLGMEVFGRKQGGNQAHWFALPGPLPLQEVRLEVLNGVKWEASP